MVFFGLLVSALLSMAQAQEAQVLEPLVTRGSATDIWWEESLWKTEKKTPQTAVSDGSIVRSVGNQEPIPVSDNGTPGSLSSVRGWGKGSEETEVRTLGVPLNPPQGGGFDFSVFPQFLWSQTRFRLGPSPIGTDSRAVSASLFLEPWSQSAIEASGENGFGSFFASAPHGSSTKGLTQTAAGFRVIGEGGNSTVAGVAGYSAGQAKGPAASLSSRFKTHGSMPGELRFHLLGGQIDAPQPGTIDFPSPHARQDSMRLVPVVQWDLKAPGGALFKSSFFYDQYRLHYTDPGSYESRDRAQQVGVEFAYQRGPLKAGATGRWVELSQIGFTAPLESIYTIQSSYLWVLGGDTGSWALEPQVRLAAFRDYGVSPQGGLTLKKDTEDAGSFTFRGTFSEKAPSLLDRFYQYPGYVPNPSLKTEKVLSLQALSEFEDSSGWGLGFEALAQKRTDAQVKIGSTRLNAGSAHSLTLTQKAHLEVGHFSFRNALAGSASEVEATHASFPSQPEWVDTLQLVFNQPRWDFTQSTRAQGGFRSFSGQWITPYFAWDSFVRVSLFSPLSLTLRVENLLKNRVVFNDGFPLTDRVWSLALHGNF